MKFLITNSYCIVFFSALTCLLSLSLSIYLNDVEWFQASGAVVTVGGVLLAARKVIRLGIKEFIRDERIIDLGHIVPTPEEIEKGRQFKLDVNAYKWSIKLLIFGTFTWAYGGIILKATGVGG